MKSYHLVQTGEAFENDLDATLSATGAYVVKTKSHKDGKEEVLTGTLNLPADTYDGMAITIAKNLRPGASETVHIVAFTPSPRIIALELAPVGTEHVLLGSHKEAVSHIALKPHLGTILRFFARLKGQSPPDSDLWIDTEELPAFVKFQGPMYFGPVWRITLFTPTWPQ
jgi:hypothetical protein